MCSSFSDSPSSMRATGMPVIDAISAAMSSARDDHRRRGGRCLSHSAFLASYSPLSLSTSDAQVGRRLVVLLAGRRLDLAVELVEALLDLAQLRRHRLRVDDVLGRGLVDQVDRLVGQEAVGDVAVREAGGRLDARRP